MMTNTITENITNEIINEDFDNYKCEDKWVYTGDNSLMEKPSGPMDYTVFVNDIVEEFGNLSIEAQQFIENHFEKNSIRRIREDKGQVGFSRDGPEPDMRDLYVQTKDDKVHMFSYYHSWKLVNDIAEEFDNLSIEAQKFIENHFEKNTILTIREDIGPVGFSRDGPDAEKRNLCVQTKDEKVHMFSYYHNGKHGGYKIHE